MCEYMCECTYEYMYVSVCVVCQCKYMYECGGTCLCAWTCIWRPEDNLKCWSSGAAILIFKVGVLSGPELAV